jgi:hypothetical protein
MTQALLMSAPAQSKSETARPELDRAVEAVREKAQAFARLDIGVKIGLLRACMDGVLAVAEDWVREGCRAKGIPFDAALAGEEWIAGPVCTMRNLRLFAESLESTRASGKPAFGRGLKPRPDGRLEVSVFPSDSIEGVLFAGFSASILFEKGADERGARERQASFYSRKDPKGGVSLILGAGNVSSIPPMDVLYKMFVEGNVCVLKMNPVNEWVGPYLERALAPLIAPGYLRVVYGGGDVGKYLVEHAGIDDIHITGSDKTHDLIVWGPPGPERDRRKASNDPVLKKTITSELGNVSPIAIVPGEYTDAELWFQARNVGSMVANNGSFNCNAGKVLITAKGWPQRDKFLGFVRKALSEIPTRKAYYPGAFDRYEMLTSGRERVEKFGQATSENLAWAFIPGVDAGAKDEKLFEVEPFCGILSQTEIGTTDPAEFLATATAFMNDRIWGTLNAAIVISPRLEKDPSVARALDRAIVDLRYGSVAVNHWPGLSYGFVTTAWGGHPSATLANIQSGLGWVHNAYLFEGIEKSVVRGPCLVSPKPAWFYDNANTHSIGRKLVGLEYNPSWLKVPGIAISALFG